MTGLSASQLHPASLYAGDTIEYYSRCFVAGDARGLRSSVVLGIKEDVAAEYPISVDTGEMIPRDMMMKLTVDRFGNRFKPQYAVWRKLRTYTLIPGTCSAPTRASVFNVAISHAIRDAFGATADELRRTREGIVEETLDAVDGAEVDDLVSDHHSTLPSTPPDPDAAPDDIVSYVDAEVVSMESEGFAEMHEAPPIEADDNSVTVCENEMHSSAPVMNNEGYNVGTSVPTTSGDATTSEETASTPIVDRITAPTDQELQDANNYLRSIPTRLERAKKRHQPKKRGCPWHKPRSRKRRYQTKCAVTRSGTQIYHAHSIKAKKVKQLLKIAGVKSRLKALRLRRPNFKELVKGGRVLLDEVPWPDGVRKISSCERNGIIFPDLGSYCKCRCIGDCFWDSCDNAEAAVYCTPSCCNLGARCSNAPIERSTLKLFDTGRVGLGVYTTTDMDIGDVVGEYTGKLSEWSARLPGQPDQALKENSGYTLLYNAKSKNRKYVYVDAAQCGSITRFVSHACDPNAVFVEL
ncbi:hypothetical protein F444_18897, partial [Phytophthora nicotianae P1976]